MTGRRNTAAEARLSRRPDSSSWAMRESAEAP